MAGAVTAAGGTITVLIGAVLLRLTLGDTYQRYVREGMGTWLLVAGVALVALGAVTLVRALRHSGHDHEHGVGVGWLLLAPIAALLLVAPPTLGSYGSAGALPTKDQWFQVTGTFEGVDGDVPRLAATSLVAIPAPVDPYE
jgi:hypothetical protein